MKFTVGFGFPRWTPVILLVGLLRLPSLCDSADMRTYRLTPLPLEVQNAQDPDERTLSVEAPDKLLNPGLILLAEKVDSGDKASVSVNGHRYPIPGFPKGLTAKLGIPLDRNHLVRGTNSVTFRADGTSEKFSILDGKLDEFDEPAPRVLGLTYRSLSRKVHETIEAFDFVTQYRGEFDVDPSQSPDWAARGKVRLYRSGFDSNRLDRMEEILRQGHFNMIQVGWNRGYSWQTEAPSRKENAQTIRWCHDRGIRVMAYVKASVIRYQEMFENEPESRQWVKVDDWGKPIGYSRDPERYHVHTNHPGWIRYVLRNVESAIDAGADEIYFDNCQTETDNLMRLFHEVRKLIDRKGGGITLYCNPKGDLLVDRMCELLKSESLVEPGYRDGQIFSNVGMYRFYYAAGDGWKPFRAKYGGPIFRGEKGNSAYLLESGWRRPMAEAAAFQGHFVLAGASGEFFQTVLEGEGKETILRDWRDICRYNAFFETHEDLYTAVEAVGKVGVLKPPEIDWEAEFFDSLGNANIVYEIVLLPRISLDRLRKYKVLVAPNVTWMTAEQLEILAQYKKQGGRIYAAGGMKELQELSDVDSPDWPGETTVEWLRADFLKNLHRLSGPPVVSMKHDAPVVANLVRKIGQKTLLLHLLNYSSEPVRDLSVSLDLSDVDDSPEDLSLSLISPDEVSPELTKVHVHDRTATFTIPELDVYNVVIVR